ncbi:MAG: hypothetical protein HYS18_16020 [Burkholderiales bacterium]|nr:hypothetical protein [Burkholderiales bacterium]
MAGRRWGASVAGALAGFPVVTGPILLFVAIEQGESFAAHAAVGAINAVLCNIAFGIAYAWVSRKYSWQWSLAAGMVVYFVTVGLFNLVYFSAILAAAVTVVGLLIAPRLYPMDGADAETAIQPKSDLVHRMTAGALLVITVTLLSERLGPNLTGLFSVFPVMGSVLAVFSHRNIGQRFAVRLLRAMARGFQAFTLFCLVLAFTLERGSIGLAFCVALLAALMAQALLMRYAR